MTDAGVRPCCIPECGHLVPRTRTLPVCHECGVQIALAHFHEASLLDEVTTKVRRQAEASRRAIREGRTPTAQVYYVRLDDERIKIGFTSRLKTRVSALRVAPSALMAREPGGRAVEAERHHQFRKDRLNAREEFHPSVELLRHIEAVRREHGLPKWVSLPDTRAITRRVK